MKVSLRKYIGAIAYPPGSIYCTTKEIDPATVWGGTWEKLEGKFLFGSDNSHGVGTVGGEETHTLTANEIPEHGNHLYTSFPGGHGNTAVYLSAATMSAYGTVGRGWNNLNGGEMYPAGYLIGGSKSHNNMPPYQVVHMWVRKTLRGGATS